MAFPPPASGLTSSPVDYTSPAQIHQENQLPEHVQSTSEAVHSLALDLIPREIEDKVDHNLGDIQVEDQTQTIRFTITFGDYGPSAKVEKSKLEQLSAHAKASFESTYELIKQEHEVLSHQLQRSSKEQKRLKALQEQIAAFRNMSSFSFTTKYGKSFLNLNALDESGKRLKVSIELDLESSGVFAVIQNEIDRTMQKYHKLKMLYDLGDLMPNSSVYDRFIQLRETKPIWSNPEHYEVEIEKSSTSEAHLYISLVNASTREILKKEPLGEVEKRWVQKVSGKKAKTGDVFQLLHTYFKEAIQDKDSDFAEESGYTRYQAERTGRIHQRAPLS